MGSSSGEDAKGLKPAAVGFGAVGCLGVCMAILTLAEDLGMDFSPVVFY